MILNFDIRPQPKAKGAGKKEKPAKQAPVRQVNEPVRRVTAKKPYSKPLLRVFSLSELGLCKQIVYRSLTLKVYKSAV